MMIKKQIWELISLQTPAKRERERERERESVCVCVKKSQIIYNLSSPLGDPIFSDQILPLFSTYTHHTPIAGQQL
jgi:hypothetical protein